MIARARRVEPAPPAVVDPAPAPVFQEEHDDSWQQRALAFAVEVRGSLSSGQLHETIAKKLPPMLGVDHLWIETIVGGRRKVVASPAAANGPVVHPLMEAPG